MREETDAAGDAEVKENEEDEEADVLDEDTPDAELAKGYEYLLGMKSKYHFA